MCDALASAEISNEFAAVRLAVRPFGRGTRLEVRSDRLGTTAMLDATVLEALSRLSQESLAELVGAAMLASDATVDGPEPDGTGPATTRG